MVNVTLFMPNELKSRMDSHKEISWSSAIRTAIEEKLDAFEEAETLAKKSRLSEKDVEKLAGNVDAAMARHAEALLRETRR